MSQRGFGPERHRGHRRQSGSRNEKEQVRVWERVSEGGAKGEVSDR